MATKKYDAVATIGEYKGRNGETKKRYVNVGSVFENDKGQLSLKLDAVPVGQEWTGWISFFEPKERDGQRSQGPGRDVSAQEATRKMHGGEGNATVAVTQADDETDDETDLPF